MVIIIDEVRNISDDTWNYVMKHPIKISTTATTSFEFIGNSRIPNKELLLIEPTKLEKKIRREALRLNKNGRIK